MSELYNFDCHYYNGYTARCDKHGGECKKRCKGFITEKQWLEATPETDLRISVAKLREVLEKLVADGDIEPIHVSVDEIINRVKKEK